MTIDEFADALGKLIAAALNSKLDLEEVQIELESAIEALVEEGDRRAGIAE